METITLESLDAIQTVLRAVNPELRKPVEQVLFALCTTQYALGFENGLKRVAAAVG